jgi:predicted DNA-binding WGR domain protein
MRRFERVEGSSSKFWEIAIEGASFTVRFGRIGTQGQTQTKSFATDDQARAAHDKLVAEKVKKGYAEVDAGDAPPLAAKPAPIEDAKPSEASEAGDEVPVAPAVIAPRAPLVATDPSTWPAELRAELHPSRAWAEPPIALDRAALWKKLRERAAKTKSKLKSVTEHVEARQRLASATPPDALADGTIEIAVARLVCEPANVWNELRWATAGLELIVDHWVATGALADALRLCARLHATGIELMEIACNAVWMRLARHAASAPEHEWTRAFELVPELASQAKHARPPLAAALAYVFPETGEGDRLVRAAAPGSHGYANLQPLAVAAITGLDTLHTFASQGTAHHLGLGTTWPSGSYEPTLYTFVARFGEDALEPFVALMDRDYTHADATRALARAIGLVSTPRAFELLTARANDKHVLAALSEAALRTPEAALGALAQAASGRTAAAQSVRAILAQIVRSGDVSEAEAALPDGLRAVIAGVRAAGGLDREEARMDEVPAVLARPPWTQPKKRAEAPVIEGVTPLPWMDAMAWPSDLRARWRAHVPDRWASDWQQSLKSTLRTSREELDALEREDPVAIERLRTTKGGFTVYGPPLAAAPLGVARSVLLALASQPFWAEDEALRKLAADHELAFLEPLLAYATHHVAEGLAVLLPYASARAAPIAASALHRSKKAQQVARAWLLRHPQAAATGLVAITVGTRGKEREAAEHALRMLAREGHEGVVMDVAERHGDSVRAAVRAVLDFDARDLFPTKMPRVPAFVAPGALPRPVLASGKALPTAVMEPLIQMLAISRLDAPYQGVLDVRDACEPGSLAALGWELFQSWLVAGAPSKESWAFTQLGLLGDDECARKLAALVRVWPGESAHQRAVTGLEVLASIGTDVALMHLHGIAQKVKFKGLQEKAREKIAAIADARELTAEELADRLVPDLGLDEDGSIELDFGARTFRVAFDELLRPFVRDASGTRVGELPKPRKDDDAEKAKAATERWKALKKDAKTLAAQQVTRLEQAMCTRRRWSDAVFRRFLVEHPLMRHLAVRLLWGVYDEDDALQTPFRVAEDWTFADGDDAPWELPTGARIGIPHALEPSPEDAARFGETLADYEILQPFPQLGRETFALTDEEKKASSIERWKGRVVPTGSVLGLESRGWRRGAPQDGGVIHAFEKEVLVGDGTVLLTLDFEPGIIAGAATEWKEQTIHGVGLGRDWRWHKHAATTLGELHPILASELLRDIEHVVASAG